MDNYSNSPYQNSSTPTPPQKSKSAWVKWVIIGVLVFGFFTAVFLFVGNIGKKFGNVIKDISENALTHTDSLEAAQRQTDYDSVYAMIAKDSSSADLKLIIDGLKKSSDSIVEMLNIYQKGFNDSIEGVNTLSRLTQMPSQRYFLKTGRATVLKNILLAYRENEINALPPFAQDSTLRDYLPIDDYQKLVSAYLRKFTGWENTNFNQPVMNVNINFRSIRTNVRNFEGQILKRFLVMMTTSQNSGMKIIMPNGDTLK